MSATAIPAVRGRTSRPIGSPPLTVKGVSTNSARYRELAGTN
jgi:hypothetical protein